MSVLRSIYVQYALETLLFAGFLAALFSSVLKSRGPRAVLVVLVALNVARFSGCAAALSRLHGTLAPAFHLEVAIGDGLTAALAVMALLLLWRRSSAALPVTEVMNVVGLTSVVVSIAWMAHLEADSLVLRASFVNRPVVGAAFLSAVHLFVFYVIGRIHGAQKTAPV